MSRASEAVTGEFLGRLRGFVRQRVRSEADADDVVQDVLAKLVRHEREVEGSVQGWLFAVARNAIVDRSRGRRGHVALEGDAVAAAGEDVEAGAAVTELARCLEPMLASMEAGDREVLRRVDMEGASQTELAREMGLSVSGMKSRVQRARGRLLGLLEGCCAIERDGRGGPVEYRRRPGGCGGVCGGCGEGEGGC